MEKLKLLFDDFVFHTRIIPILVVMLPLIAIALFKGLSVKDIVDTSVYFLILIVFLSFSSRISRELGRRYEEKMIKELNAEPTTILMRFSDKTIDKLSKIRYHMKLNNCMNNIELPLSEKDENDETDLKYKSAIVWLRNYANSNRIVEYRVYQELKEYNYWRNIYGCKIPMIILYFLMLIREVILIDNLNIETLFLEFNPDTTTIIILLISIIFSIILINKKTVMKKAFDYAKALIEVCERI